MVLCLLDDFYDVLIQPFVPNCSIVAFDIGILLWLAGLNMLKAYLTFFLPRKKFAADILRAVVDTNGLQLAAPLYNLVQTSYYPLRRKREVDLDAKAFTVEVIKDI